MANPSHFGSAGGPHRHRPNGIHQDYLGYQQQATQANFGFEYNGTSQGQSNSDQQPLHYAPSMVPLDQQRRMPSEVTPALTFDYAPNGNARLPQGFYNVDGNTSPPSLDSGSSFNGFQGVENGLFTHLHLPTSEWSSGSSPQPPTPAKRHGNGTSGKVPRHQFTACGACRHRRVKCDLRARQDEAEREAVGDDTRRRKVSCTNCQERETNCVDEYAPLKAAKQLRRGKRISEIEMLYGKSATNAALASQGDEERSLSPTSKPERLPDLTREFFESPFFRRFHVQRPVLDSHEFVARYLSKPIPCAAAMGAEGSVLCHVLYAWAVSYGVDERGALDVPEGGEPLPINILAPSDAELARDKDRQGRMDKMNRIIRTILREIDEHGLMRRPTWDGVRALLLINPLTEGISSPIERQALWQAALSQVHMLCSQQGVGYDGLPVTTPPSPVTDDEQRQRLVQMRIFWYAFVQEGINTGLRGSCLFLDGDEDFTALEESVQKQPSLAGHFHPTLRMVVAPIRYSMACRIVNECLTGSKARRRALDPEAINAAWDALDQSWEEFTLLRSDPPAPPFRETQEITHFADSWKITTYKAYHTILTTLDERLKLSQSQNTALQLRLLRDIAKSRCEVRVRQITDMLRDNTGTCTSFTEWTSLRDSLFHVATYIAKNGGDLDLLLRVMNESRWAFAKAGERSAELRAGAEWPKVEVGRTNSEPSVRPFPPSALPHSQSHGSGQVQNGQNGQGLGQNGQSQSLPLSHQSPFPFVLQDGSPVFVPFTPSLG